MKARKLRKIKYIIENYLNEKSIKLNLEIYQYEGNIINK